MTAPQSIQDFKLVNDELLPELRQLLRVDPDRNVQEKITQLLNQLSELCFVTTIAHGEIQPMEQNQIMLDNLGKYNCVCCGNLERNKMITCGACVGIVSEILNYVLSARRHCQMSETQKDAGMV